MNHAADGAFGASWAGQSSMGFGAHARHDRYVDIDATEGERTYAMFMHLTSVLTIFAGIPVVGALIMWAIKNRESPFLDDHGKEAIRFQLSLFLYGLMLIPIGFLTLGVGAVLGGIAIFALGIVGTILGTKAAHRGEYFRYPMTLRFF